MEVCIHVYMRTSSYEALMCMCVVSGRKGMCVRDRLSNYSALACWLVKLASLVVNSEQYNATPVGSPCNQAHDDRLSTCRSNALSCIGII
jgi:hypothetical protein